jgi:GTPase SAR1 family protein
MSEKMDLIKGAVQASNNDKLDNMTSYNEGIFIGEALGDDEKINSLMSSTKPEIIVLVGFVGYGKTSFVASCYHILLTEGRIGEYTFYDSDTLTGFERRIYLRRLSSIYDDITPMTKRTIRGEPHLLTFRFSHPGKEDKVMVISDHSGEDYDKYRDNKSNLEKDILIKNADRIFFFVDCEKLVNNQRLAIQNYYSQLIQNMHEMESFKNGVLIQFLFNKIDLVTADKENKFHEEKRKFLEKMASVLQLPIGESIEVISNQVEDKSVEGLLLDIIENTRPSNQGEGAFLELDWVKTMLK